MAMATLEASPSRTPRWEKRYCCWPESRGADNRSRQAIRMPGIDRGYGNLRYLMFRGLM